MRFFILFFLSFSLIFSASGETKEIRFWQFWDQDWIQPVIDRFEADHPSVKIKVERLTWDQGFNKIITAMAANQAPDVVEIGTTWVVSLGNDGGLKSIDPGDLLKTHSGWISYKGKYYAYPWTASTNAVFYNRDLLKKAGISELPKDWNELLEASKKISDLGDDIYGYGIKTGLYTTWQKFLPFAWSNGRRVLNTSTGKTEVNTPEFLEAVEFYQKLAEVGLVDENTNIRKSFQQGKIGFMPDDPGRIKQFSKESPDLNFDVMKLPSAPRTGKSINFSGGQMLAISKNSKYPKEAEEFIRFMLKTENTKAITSRLTTLFPTAKNIDRDPFYQKENPQLLVFIENLKNASSPAPDPRWNSIREVFNLQMETILLDIVSPKEGMQNAEKEINAILKEEP